LAAEADLGLEHVGHVELGGDATQPAAILERQLRLADEIRDLRGLQQAAGIVRLELGGARKVRQCFRQAPCPALRGTACKKLAGEAGAIGAAPQRHQPLSCKLRMLSRNDASMISMPPTIRAAAGIVSRMTTLGSSAPNPASRHCQKAAPLQNRPQSAAARPSSRPRSSVRVLSS